VSGMPMLLSLIVANNSDTLQALTRACISGV
jgi:hypothetical protein